MLNHAMDVGMTLLEICNSLRSVCKPLKRKGSLWESSRVIGVGQILLERRRGKFDNEFAFVVCGS